MKKSKMSALGLAIFTLAQIATPVMAANPYGMDYTGGEVLGDSNVTINPTFIDGLSPLIAGTNQEGSFTGPWLDGYFGPNCHKIKYIKVSASDPIDESDGLAFSFKDATYVADIKIANIMVDPAGDNDTYAVIIDDNDIIEAGYFIYDDAACTNRVPDIKRVYTTQDKIFVQTNIKLYKNGDSEVFVSDGLYFGITDIDAGQSYKILNLGNQLTANNMYAVSAADLQPGDPSITLRNMFDSTNHYIYSQYEVNGGGKSTFNITASDNDIYVKINEATWLNGLDVVFGFTSEAGSGIRFYAKQYTVTYESDEGGTITGITDEQVISGDTPLGSTEESKENYELDYWKTDKDVTLTDGTTIKAGEPITIEQIKKVVVNEDLTFTAIHKAKIKVPDIGAFTEDINGMLVSLPVIGILLGALMLGLLPKLTHKKISFKK